MKSTTLRRHRRLRPTNSPNLPGEAALAVLLAAALGLTLFACNGSQQTADKDASTAIDLIPLYSLAAQRTETGVIDLSSVKAGYYLSVGWSDPMDIDGDGSLSVVAIAQRAAIRFGVLKKADRWLEFTARAKGRFGGPQKQHIEYSINQTPLGELDVEGEEPVDFRIKIPAEMLRVGTNLVRLQLSEIEENPDYMRFRKKSKRGGDFPYSAVAAYFSDMRIILGRDGEPAPEWSKDENQAFTLVGDGRNLNQQPNSELAYAFDIAAGSVINIAGSVQGPRGEGGEVVVAVHARTDGNPGWRELWSESYTMGRRVSSYQYQAEIPLDSLAGRAAELRFSAYSTADFSQAVVTWRAAQLHLQPNASAPEEAGSREPARITEGVKNVIILVLDAARPDFWGCYGAEDGATPYIDELAKSSLRFKNAICAAPYTIASVSSLFSSVLPERHGVRDSKDIFPEDLENIARIFKRGGYYTTAAAGLPFVTRKFGMTREFDNVVYMRSQEDRKEENSTMDMDLLRDCVEEAASSGKPWMFYIHLLPPHWPYNPPAPFDSIYTSGGRLDYKDRRATRVLLGSGTIEPDHPDVHALMKHYKNNLRYADDLVRRMVEMLEARGLYDSTLFIVSADHGEAFADHGRMGHNSTTYEEMIRVPLIVHFPGVQPRVEEQLVGLIDILPTLVELFDLPVESVQFDGRSFAPLLLGRELQPADYYYCRAADKGGLKFCLRGQRFKYMHDGPRMEFYDLEGDPRETDNIIGRYPATAASLRLRGLMMIKAREALRGGEGEEVELTDEELRELRNLGYLQ